MAQYHDLSDLKKLSHDLKVQAKAAQEAKRVQAAKANRLGAEAAGVRGANGPPPKRPASRMKTTPADAALQRRPNQRQFRTRANWKKKRFSKNPSQTSAIPWCFLRATTA